MQSTTEKFLALIGSDFFREKCVKSDLYAQNLYAALCQNLFVEKQDVFSIIQQDGASVSWRQAGNIVGTFRGETYLQYYCSGMSNTQGYKQEGEVSDEVRADFDNAGWLIIQRDTDDK